MRKFTINAIPALLVLALLAGCGSSSSSKTSTETSTAASGSGGESGVTVKTASIPSAGGTVLVDSSGMTLYSLSAERNGKFICTGSCESTWHPLMASGTPAGVGSLGTVKRPNGEEQVTYKGMPLYTFANDAKPGEAKGQGFKDVGTWSAVTTSASSGGGASTSTSGSSSGGSSGGGY